MAKTYKITTQELADMLANMYKADPTIYRPFLWGKMGIGKSQVVQQVAKALGIELLDIRMALLDDVDLMGIPYTETMIDQDTGKSYKMTKWATNGAFPQDPNWKGIIFLDEFNQAKKSVMNACYQLVQDRQIGDYHLPKGAMVICAGNPADCNIYATELPEALKNRFQHYYLEPNLDSWVEWALDNQINENIIGFLKNNDLLFDDSQMGQDIFATPRTWEKVSRTLDMFDRRELAFTIITGLIGTLHTTELFNYIDDKNRYQNPDEILFDGKDFRDTDFNKIYGCSMACLMRLKNLVKDSDLTKALHNLFKALDKLPQADLKVFTAKRVVKDDRLDMALSNDDLVKVQALVKQVDKK